MSYRKPFLLEYIHPNILCYFFTVFLGTNIKGTMFSPSIYIIFFLKACYGWLKLLTCSYAGGKYYTEKNGYVQKMTGCRIKIVKKFYIFVAIKGVGLSLYIWRSRKTLKGLLQNIYLMLELLYHKLNSCITINGSIF